MAFVSRWSADLKSGVFAAVFDHGLSARAAWQLAQTGQLPQTVPGQPRAGAQPDLPLGTVADWCRHERIRRQRVEVARGAPDAVLGDTVARLIAVHEREVRRAEVLSSRGKLARGELAKIARDGREIVALQRAVQTGSSGAPVPRSNGAAPVRESGWLEQLAQGPDETT